MSDPILPFDVWPTQIVQAAVPANRNALRAQILASDIVSFVEATQPATPADGAVYVLPAGATGAAWAIFDADDLAIFRDGAWYAFAPVLGVVVHALGGDRYQFQGSAGWVLLASTTTANWGYILGDINTQTDLIGILDTKLESVVAGTGVSVDNTDPLNPVVSASGAAPDWGDIGGTLSDQTDLQAALDTKLESVVAGTGVSVDNTDPLNPVVSASGAAPDWGDIGGTLSDQTDLQGALDTKLESVVAGAGVSVDNTDPLNPVVSAGGTGTLEVTFDAGTGALANGALGDLVIPYAGTITEWVLIGNAPGTASVSVWVDTLANFPPTGADDITGANPPALSASQTAADSTLTGWTTAVSAGQIMRFTLGSPSGLSRLTLTIKVLK